MTQLDGDLHRLVYRSRAEPPAPAGASRTGALDEIIEASHRRNAERGVTGALLVAGDTFIQALEGGGDELEQLFETICCDLRHSAVELVEFGRVDRRAFGDWGLQLVQPQTALQTLFRHLDVNDAARDSEATAEAVRLMAAVVSTRADPPSPASV